MRIKCLAVLAAVGLAAAVLTMLLWPQTVREGRADEPDVLVLNGLVRDFHRAHVDFDVTPSAGFGHYAGSVDPVLSDDRRPLLVNGGFKVESEWRDGAGRPIAPHLQGVGGSGDGGIGVRVREQLTLDKGTIDSFDSSIGLYGVDGNRGGDAVVSTNATSPGAADVGNNFTVDGDVMIGPGGDPAVVISGGGVITGTRGVLDGPVAFPAIDVPTDDVVGPNLGDVWYKHVPSVISENMHVDDFRISTDAVVTISGNVKILVEGEFRTETKGVLQVLPGASLDLYVRGPKFTVETRCLWSDPRDTRVWVIGSPLMKIQTDADFFGAIYAPDASLLVQTDADLHGSYVGRALEIKTGGAIHVDLAGAAPGCIAIADVGGAQGSEGSGGIASAESFRQWFRDVLGVNQSMARKITLTDLGGGVFGYLDDAFHPIDGRLFGNEGDPHNNYFTYVIAATFTFVECADQFIEFEGGDGFWLYVDGRLAMDLGGVRSATEQYIELDRLGLVDGESYTAHLFHAQRDPSQSVFRLRTNVPLDTSAFVPTVTNQFD